MTDAMAGVLIMAIFVFGVAGTAIAGAILQKVVPLLEALARGRAESPGETEALRAAVAALEARVGELEGASRRVGELEDQVVFMERLLASREGAVLVAPGE